MYYFFKYFFFYYKTKLIYSLLEKTTNLIESTKITNNYSLTYASYSPRSFSFSLSLHAYKFIYVNKCLHIYALNHCLHALLNIVYS